MILHINTTQSEKNESEPLLKIIDDTFKKNKLQKPRAVIVVKGPHGRFSAIRSGVATANALAFAWDVPVVGILQGDDIRKAVRDVAHRRVFDQLVVPLYDREPNIT